MLVSPPKRSSLYDVNTTFESDVPFTSSVPLTERTLVHCRSFTTVSACTVSVTPVPTVSESSRYVVSENRIVSCATVPFSTHTALPSTLMKTLVPSNSVNAGTSSQMDELELSSNVFPPIGPCPAVAVRR